MSNHPLHHIRRSIAAKLILSIGILFFLGGGMSWYTLISSGKKNLMKDAVENATSYSDLVKKSIRYSMVTFHREAIQQTIGEVGSRKEIRGLRIFDSSGKIAYSAEKGEIGRMVERKASACTGCHDGGKSPARDLVVSRQWLISAGAGERVLTS